MGSIGVAVSLSQLFCFHADGVGFDSEPYMWTIMFTLDGSSITQNGNALAGNPKYFLSPGSHGNLGSGISTGGTLNIPTAVGRWETTLQPIVITLEGTTVHVPGVIGVLAILMEEGDTPNADIEAGHQALNSLVTGKLNQFVASIDLVAVGAEVEQLVGPDLDETAAAIQVFQTLLKPVTDDFKSYAAPVVFYAIFQSAGLGGEILTAIDSDDFQGSLFHQWDQTTLAQTATNGQPGQAGVLPPIQFTDFLAEQSSSASWAYNVSGAAWQTVHVYYPPVPEGVPPGRQQVSFVRKNFSRELDRHWISHIGGTLSNGKVWWLERATAVNLILSSTNSFFEKGKDGSQANVIVSDALNLGHDYLTTTPDASTEDNLSTLPGFPPEIPIVTSTA